MNAALSNAERQKRYRERVRDKADALDGSPKQIAEAIFGVLSIAKAKKVVRLLDKRLRSIKPNCPVCKGTGISPPLEFRGPCGMVEGRGLSLPCDCGEMAAAWIENGKKWAETGDAQQCKVNPEKE